MIYKRFYLQKAYKFLATSTNCENFLSHLYCERYEIDSYKEWLYQWQICVDFIYRCIKCELIDGEYKPYEEESKIIKYPKGALLSGMDKYPENHPEVSVRYLKNPDVSTPELLAAYIAKHPADELGTYTPEYFNSTPDAKAKYFWDRPGLSEDDAHGNYNIWWIFNFWGTEKLDKIVEDSGIDEDDNWKNLDHPSWLKFQQTIEAIFAENGVPWDLEHPLFPVQVPDSMKE